ncbi:hypothetical protein ABH931_005520 [Streptacidiphilus sp. MAP12-33]
MVPVGAGRGGSAGGGADGAPLAAQQSYLLAWFTPSAMTLVDALGVQVRDRVGDEHARSVDMLKGAERRPTLEQGW